MFPFNTPYNHLLYWSFLFATVPWLYSYFNEHHRLASMSVDQAVMKSWDRVIVHPSIKFRKVVVGINVNVDAILSGVGLINKLNLSSAEVCDHEVIGNLKELYEAFIYFFSRGAPAERYCADEDAFQRLATAVEDKNLRAHYSIGGNAALMAQKIATGFPLTTTYLVGPIGPRANALLHPSIERNNSTRIVQDELHVILQYKQGEILGEYVSPASSRFITSHDQYSGSSVVIEMFFKAIAQYRPDLIMFSGVHLLEGQPRQVRLEKLRMIKRSLLQVNPLVPIHFSLGSMGDSSHVHEVLYRIIPYVDSLFINEQELAFISKVGNGPYQEQYPVRAGTLHAYKVVEMLNWLLTTLGHDRSNPAAKNYNYRLQRIHFHCLTYHIVVSRGTDWSNLAAGLAAGARLAGRQSCNIVNEREDHDKLEIRTSGTVLLDKQMDKVYQFNQYNPIASWMRNDVVYIYTPVLVCKFPQHIVGVDDAISVTALLYSQFYKMEKHQ
ncbi:hypothetical protein M3Y95_01214000 [Aphelenchoides besseyi]|nr:hypothetical protein M3Y95_01214000 [Aphelenchoides besseyi]